MHTHAIAVEFCMQMVPVAKSFERPPPFASRLRYCRQPSRVWTKDVNQAFVWWASSAR